MAPRAHSELFFYIPGKLQRFTLSLDDSVRPVARVVKDEVVRWDAMTRREPDLLVRTAPGGD